MKITLIIASVLGMAGLTQAAVTLQFSDTTNYLTNFATGAGSTSTTPGAAAASAIATNGSNRMVWGIIVDGGTDGFNGASGLTPYKSGFSLAANTSGISLSTTTTGLDSVSTNDVLYIAGAVMASNSSALDGSSLNMNRLLSFTGLTYSGAVAQGKSFAIVWFDKTALGGNSTDGLQYGVFATGLTLPADPGTYNLASNFAGGDAVKTQAYALNTIVPEPSSALLGMVGALGLLRRRRN